MGNPAPKPPPPPPAAAPLAAALHEVAAELNPRSPMYGPVRDLAAAVPTMDAHQARAAAIRAMMHVNGMIGGNAPTQDARRAMYRVRQLCSLT